MCQSYHTACLSACATLGGLERRSEGMHKQQASAQGLSQRDPSPPWQTTRGGRDKHNPQTRGTGLLPCSSGEDVLRGGAGPGYHMCGLTITFRLQFSLGTCLAILAHDGQRVGLLFLITAVSHGFATAANKMPSALDSLSRAWLRLLF